eukprot:SAG31_NODE_4396_length_3270_cov_54.708925_2_plen_122_part_00
MDSCREGGSGGGPLGEMGKCRKPGCRKEASYCLKRGLTDSDSDAPLPAWCVGAEDKRVICRDCAKALDKASDRQVTYSMRRQNTPTTWKAHSILLVVRRAGGKTEIRNNKGAGGEPVYDGL